MILSGKEILKEVENGKLVIEPFDERRINPNSYNLRLHNELHIYTDSVLDMKKRHETELLTIPDAGLLLEPGRLYLGRTLEYTKTSDYVPMLEGRSSVGRLGLCIHVTTGVGNIGFAGYWTLEIRIRSTNGVFIIFAWWSIGVLSIHSSEFLLLHETVHAKNTTSLCHRHSTSRRRTGAPSASSHCPSRSATPLFATVRQELDR